MSFLRQQPGGQGRQNQKNRIRQKQGKVMIRNKENRENKDKGKTEATAK